MGCASSTPVTAANVIEDSAAERQARAEYEHESSKIKLLLLGAGESGKSTVFKQMRILYGKGYSTEERQQMTAVVFNNTITSMKALLAACHDLGYETESPEAAATFAKVSDDAPITHKVGALIKLLWADPAVQRAYAQRHTFQLNDSAKYFFDKIGDLIRSDYMPTIEDMLKTRVRTSGILEEEYVIQKVTFAIYDVGGQRNERRKWIHCFEDVTAIIFVAAISEYDQTLFEDNQVNRLVEALNLFDDVANSRWFETTSIILFLNKRDLFAEKITHVDLKQLNPNPFAAEKSPYLFADYTGGCNYDAAVQYIVSLFLARNRSPKKEIYWQVTCATDTDNVDTVFQATREIILKSNLKASGFLDS